MELVVLCRRFLTMPQYIKMAGHCMRLSHCRYLQVTQIQQTSLNARNAPYGNHLGLLYSCQPKPPHVNPYPSYPLAIGHWPYPSPCSTTVPFNFKAFHQHLQELHIWWGGGALDQGSITALYYFNLHTPINFPTTSQARKEKKNKRLPMLLECFICCCCFENGAIPYKVIQNGNCEAQKHRSKQIFCFLMLQCSLRSIYYNMGDSTSTIETEITQTGCSIEARAKQELFLHARRVNTNHKMDI